jgi:hypothetical protein
LPDATPRLVLQRIRNRIIETLGTMSSFDEQRRYAQRVPICYVPYELISGWQDFVDSPRPLHFTAPVFSSVECAALEEFYPHWRDAAEALPEGFPPLEEVLNSSYWVRLRDAAAQALAAFLIRGRLPEDAEVP